MTPRSIRRAQDRRANKLARKAEKAALTLPITTPEPLLPPAAPELSPGPSEGSISPAQLAANMANAQLSSGPKTTEGKAKSCLNAVKTALTGRTVLLPSDDAAAYEAHVRGFEEEFQPVGPRESELTQTIADIWWRMRRAVALQMALFARGYIEFADQFDDHPVSVRRGLIEVQTFLTYEKQLRNLQLQEARLSRRREKETAELRNLQQDRKAKEREQLDLASKPDRKKNGFEFSTAEIDKTLEPARPSQSLKTVPQAA